jgi:hypothetical protein
MLRFESTSSKNSNTSNHTNTLQASGFPLLLSIPPSELWRLAVDGRLHAEERGFLGYEAREKNSIQNFLKALLLSKDFISNELELNDNLIKKIHATCREGTEGIFDVPAGEFITHSHHGFPIYNLSLEGIKTLILFHEAFAIFISPTFIANHTKDVYDPFSAPSVENWLTKTGGSSPITFKEEFSYSVSVTKEESEKLIQFILEECNQRLQTVSKDDDVILAIIHAAYQIEHLHPFKDMNLRTTIIFINLLLMKYGFPPVMYDDPNFLDGCSKSEFFEIIKKGMLTTLNVIENPIDSYFGFSSNSFTEEENKQYTVIIAPIGQQLEVRNCKSAEIANVKKIRERIENLQLPPNPPQWILDGGSFSGEVAKHFSIHNYTKQNESFVFPRSKRTTLGNNSILSSSSASTKINRYGNLFQNPNSFFMAEAQAREKAQVEAQVEAESILDLYRGEVARILSNETTSHKEKFLALVKIGHPHGELYPGTRTCIIDLVSEHDGGTQEIINNLRERAEAIRATCNNSSSPSTFSR